MTNLKKLTFALVVIPVIGIILFSLVNALTSMLFGIPFEVLQHANIWVLYTFVIIAGVIVYVSSVNWE